MSELGSLKNSTTSPRSISNHSPASNTWGIAIAVIIAFSVIGAFGILTWMLCRWFKRIVSDPTLNVPGGVGTSDVLSVNETINRSSSNQMQLEGLAAVANLHRPIGTFDPFQEEMIPYIDG